MFEPLAAATVNARCARGDSAAIRRWNPLSIWGPTGSGSDNCLATAELRLGEDVGKLDERQRVSTGGVDQTLRHGRRQLGGDALAKQLRGGGCVEALQANLGQAAGVECTGVGLPAGEDQGDAFLPEPAGGEGERLGRGSVEPMRVVGQQQDRCVLGGSDEQAQHGGIDREAVPRGERGPPSEPRLQGGALRRGYGLAADRGSATGPATARRAPARPRSPRSWPRARSCRRPPAARTRAACSCPLPARREGPACRSCPAAPPRGVRRSGRTRFRGRAAFSHSRAAPTPGKGQISGITPTRTGAARPTMAAIAERPRRAAGTPNGGIMSFRIRASGGLAISAIAASLVLAPAARRVPSRSGRASTGARPRSRARSS